MEQTETIAQKDRGQLLAICIPTYNRADCLAAALQKWIEKIAAYKIQICISDNASTDNTNAVVEEFQAIYPHIKYRRNETNIGPDKNFEAVLQMADTEYRWLMGDDDYAKGDFETLFAVLERDCDAVLLNFPRKKERTVSEEYTDMNKLMSELGAATTFISSIIYNRRIIESKIFSDVYVSEFSKLHFAHSAALFSYLADTSGKVYFLADFSIWGLEEVVGPVRWVNKAFEYFVNDLGKTARLLPDSYTKKSKRAYVLNIRVCHFGTRGYFKYAFYAKLAGKFTLRYYCKSRKNIKAVFSFFHRVMLFHLALFPKFMAKIMIFILGIKIESRGL